MKSSLVTKWGVALYQNLVVRKDTDVCVHGWCLYAAPYVTSRVERWCGDLQHHLLARKGIAKEFPNLFCHLKNIQKLMNLRLEESSRKKISRFKEQRLPRSWDNKILNMLSHEKLFPSYDPSSFPPQSCGALSTHLSLMTSHPSFRKTLTTHLFSLHVN